MKRLKFWARPLMVRYRKKRHWKNWCLGRSGWCVGYGDDEAAAVPFITPMDREDIQQMIDQLDMTVDNISEIMDKMCMYQVGEGPRTAPRKWRRLRRRLWRKFANLSVYEGPQEKLFEGRSQEQEGLETEQECDDLYHGEMASLFKNCKDPVAKLSRRKEIFNLLKT